MSHTPLLEALLARPENERPRVVADYRGAATAAQFANPQSEFTALQNACGVYDLGFRARLSITGNDRMRWLNGMVTNNIRDLAVGRGVYAFLLNPQGHILGDMYVFNDGDQLLVETDCSQVEKIIATFDHYIIMDDVIVTNLSWQTAVGVAGPRARALLNAARILIPELKPLETISLQCDCDCGCVQCTVVRGADAHESYEIWLYAGQAYAAWRTLLTAGAVPVGSEALEMHRIVSGTPLYGVDIRERDLPQETEQTRALSFDKGCYVGQEIVERIRSRGSVHRKFTGFTTEGAAAIPPGAKIVSGDKEVGEITSVAVLHLASGDRTVALGYIRRELGVPGREIMIGNIRATVIQMPFNRLASEHIRDAVIHGV